METFTANVESFTKKIDAEIFKLSIAPMLDWTDRYCRYFFRQLSSNILLYTEMITTGALLNNDPEKFLDFDPLEHPLALQLGGSNPNDLALCVKLANTWGYDEINLNVGCPSNRVKKGKFGAYLMEEPKLVADCIQAMREASNKPITIKHRIGIDNKDTYEELLNFVDIAQKAGCKTFIVHARKAILNGLNPKQNREIPPLNYNFVHRLKNDFPDNNFIINGGIKTITEIQEQLKLVDGVMIGREAYHNPWKIAEIDKQIFEREGKIFTRKQVVENMLPFIEKQTENGIPVHQITRHMMGLFKGMPRAKLWRQHLSKIGMEKTKDVKMLENALLQI